MASHFGGWNPEDIFPSDQAQIGHDGERITDQHARDAIVGVDPFDQPWQNGNGNIISSGAIPNGIVDGADHVASGFQQFEEDIEPAQPDRHSIYPLNWRDVCAFIVNKMIGTGIFIQPPAVLLLTGSKAEALGLWFAGFVYTLVRSVASSFVSVLP
jgi:hypothetical protein